MINGLAAKCGARHASPSQSASTQLLPPRSMVGQLTLDQHIGVRIPGGQPITFRYLLLITNFRDSILPYLSVHIIYVATRILHYARRQADAGFPIGIDALAGKAFGPLRGRRELRHIGGQLPPEGSDQPCFHIPRGKVAGTLR